MIRMRWRLRTVLTFLGLPNCGMSCRNGLLPLKQTLELLLAKHQQKHRLAGQ